MVLSSSKAYSLCCTQRQHEHQVEGTDAAGQLHSLVLMAHCWGTVSHVDLGRYCEHCGAHLRRYDCLLLPDSSSSGGPQPALPLSAGGMPCS